MEKEEIKKLFKKYHEGKCTEEEKALLEAWYLQFNEHDLDITPKSIKDIGNRVLRELPGNDKQFVRIGLRLAVAAITIGFLITIGLKLIIPGIQTSTPSKPQDISPGTNSAVLTLGNGNKINLNNSINGQLATQSGITIYKTTGGQITYKASGRTAAINIPQLNNIATPKGGQWQVLLPDGSKVWLNSASSLSYVANFDNQKERIVELSGEGYFEVAKDKSHPFIVKTDKQSVEVLGTHFNINSYPDEPSVKTTLAKGSVKVTTTSGSVKFLTPGQQADLKAGTLQISKANIEEALAWKNGYFRFNNETIQSIMRKLSRWYNIDVQYAPDLSDEGLNGKVSRYKNISQVLKALEATKTVHFKVEGRRVTVLK